MNNWISDGDISMNTGEVRVGGRLIQDDGSVVCIHCNGDRGWIQKGKVLIHTGCGKKQ
jgi:hypothetical protein